VRVGDLLAEKRCLQPCPWGMWGSRLIWKTRQTIDEESRRRVRYYMKKWWGMEELVLLIGEGGLCIVLVASQQTLEMILGQSGVSDVERGSCAIGI
jgi:hypothetical protein